MLLLTHDGCSHSAANIAVTERARPATDYNARIGKGAPPVAATLDFDRITRARSEPQNWLTYHGTYDGHRFSALDQINIGNVASLRTAWVFQSSAVGLIAAPGTFAM